MHDSQPVSTRKRPPRLLQSHFRIHEAPGVQGNIPWGLRLPFFFPGVAAGQSGATAKSAMRTAKTRVTPSGVSIHFPEFGAQDRHPVIP